MTKLLPSERLAIVLFVLLLTSSAMGGFLYRHTWFVGALFILFMWLVALLLALFHVGFALRDVHQNRWARLRAAMAIPCALLAVLGLDIGLKAGPRAEASVYLLTHRAEMIAAQEKAGPGSPAAVWFVNGVPDGGMAIISWDGRPTSLPMADQVRLTGERIKWCRSIISQAWLCGYDWTRAWCGPPAVSTLVRAPRYPSASENARQIGLRLARPGPCLGPPESYEVDKVDDPPDRLP